MTRIKAPGIMGALYEDVEKFFGDIFAWYGRIVARYPVPFVLVPMLVCGLMGLGLFRLSYETDLEKLYTPIDSLAHLHQVTIQHLFPDTQTPEFYPHQQVRGPSYAKLLITFKSFHTRDENVTTSFGNICDYEILAEITDVVNLIQAMNVSSQNETFTYDDLCARRHGDCVMDGVDMVGWASTANKGCSSSPPKGYSTIRYMPSDRATDTPDQPMLFTMGSSGEHTHQTRVKREDLTSRADDLTESVTNNISETTVIVTPVTTLVTPFHQYLTHADVAKWESSLYNMELVDGCLAAEGVKLTFYLDSANVHSKSWENMFISRMRAVRSHRLDMAFSTSESLNNEMSTPVGDDTRYFIIAIGIMFIFATITGSGGNCVTNHVTLAYAGVIAALLAIVASFGFLSLCGLPFVNICGVMPFMVLGVGADDMFQLITEWRQTSHREPIADRMAHTLRSAAVSITITSMTDLLAFLIGATSPFISVKNFCACSGVAVLMCYVNQLTFLSGCLVLHARRIKANRHCITCLHTKSHADMEADGTNRLSMLMCAGRAPRSIGEEGGLCRKFSRLLYRVYPPFLLHWITKSVVMILFICYVALSFWGASQLQRGLNFRQVLPEDSYLRHYLRCEDMFKPQSYTLMVVMTEPVNYHQLDTQHQILHLLNSLQTLHAVDNHKCINWLTDLRNSNLTLPDTEQAFVHTVMTNFLPIHPQYVHDVLPSSDNTSIEASRFYLTFSDLNSSLQQTTMMQQVRKLVNDSPLPFVAYSSEFVYYEADLSILKNTLLAVGVTMIGMLFVQLVFIPHPVVVTCVTLSMFSVVVGMKGFMYFWHLSLSAFTTIQIIISVGICVNFTVHISHAFMTATGKNRNERVTVALERVGVPTLNGATSSLLCIAILCLGSSYIFNAMFKTLMLVVLLGLVHALVFLPVMLSFIGPRRTSKPRVFIPVSPSCRSLQDTYRANSIVRPPLPDSGPPRPPLLKSHTVPLIGPPLSLRSKSLDDLYQPQQTPEHVLNEKARRVSFAYCPLDRPMTGLIQREPMKRYNLDKEVIIRPPCIPELKETTDDEYVDATEEPIPSESSPCLPQARTSVLFAPERSDRASSVA